MYECHITVNAKKSDHPKLEQLARTFFWKTSYIQNDPLLGDEAFFYFTRHEDDVDFLKCKMEGMSALIEKLAGAKVIRKKIEHIVYDTKTDLVSAKGE